MAAYHILYTHDFASIHHADLAARLASKRGLPVYLFRDCVIWRIYVNGGVIAFGHLALDTQ